MSIQHCEKCNSDIDTDFNAEPFDEEANGCEATFTECGAVKCYTGCVGGTDWCEEHQSKETEELGTLIDNPEN